MISDLECKYFFSGNGGEDRLFELSELLTRTIATRFTPTRRSNDSS